MIRFESRPWLNASITDLNTLIQDGYTPQQIRTEIYFFKLRLMES